MTVFSSYRAVNLKCKMRFLIAFAAVLGYASAGWIYPQGQGINPGDAQGAAIDRAVIIRDNNREAHEYHDRAAEKNRDRQQKAYWNSVADNQNYVAAAQSQAAAIDNYAAASRAAHQGAPVGYPYGVSPYGLGQTYGLGAHGYGSYGQSFRTW